MACCELRESRLVTGRRRSLVWRGRSLPAGTTGPGHGVGGFRTKARVAWHRGHGERLRPAPGASDPLSETVPANSGCGRSRELRPESRHRVVSMVLITCSTVGCGGAAALLDQRPPSFPVGMDDADAEAARIRLSGGRRCRRFRCVCRTTPSRGSVRLAARRGSGRKRVRSLESCRATTVSGQ